MLQDLNIYTIIILAIALWTIPWKGVALWKAARNGQKAWFVVILIINTVAILEILYIFFFAKRKEGSQKLRQDI